MQERQKNFFKKVFLPLLYIILFSKNFKKEFWNSNIGISGFR